VFRKNYVERELRKTSIEHLEAIKLDLFRGNRLLHQIVIATSLLRLTFHMDRPKEMKTPNPSVCATETDRPERVGHIMVLETSTLLCFLTKEGYRIQDNESSLAGTR